MTSTAILEPTSARSGVQREVLISSDSHVLEPVDLWATRLPESMRDRVGVMPERKGDHPGGTDPAERYGVMLKDSVSMEVLFPTYGLTLFAQEDAALQESCFRVYNDWLVEYCAGTPGRLIGVPSISMYDIDHAIQELERTSRLGLKGAMLWHVPHPDLPFHSNHYDRFWAAAQDMGAPVNLHILSGFTYTRQRGEGVERYRESVGVKMFDALNVLFDFVMHGVLERFPRLKIVLVEDEIGWIPWVLQQWDYYARRFEKVNPLPLSMLPSEYFARQVYATFFNDHVGTRNFQWGWGVDNCMWSNDFPHGNSTWPKSHEIIARDLDGLAADVRARLLRENVARLYGVPIPEPIAER